MRDLKRKEKGSSIAELPVAITILFLALLFPMLDLGTIALRTATVFAAARNAAHHAGRAKSFMINGDDGDLSARNTAVNWSLATCGSGLAGTDIKDNDVQLYIIGTPYDQKNAPLRSAKPLNEVQTDKYLYQIEAQVTGRVTPLVVLSKGLLGDIPGITGPLTISASFREFCEHPDGLSL